MPIKFVLNVATNSPPSDHIAASPPDEPQLAAYRLNNPGNCHGSIGRRPGVGTVIWYPRWDDAYNDTPDANAVCGFLGGKHASFFETRAAFLYALMNWKSYQWSRLSFTISLLLIVGPGFRFAAFITYAIVVIVGAWTSPPLLDQIALTRGDGLGDFLVRFTWALWTTSALLFAISRCCYRHYTYPFKQSACFPNYMINDKLPDPRDPDYDQIVWFLWSWSMLGVLFVFLAVYTILGQLYVARNSWYAILLIVLCAYEFVAALGDVARCGSPFGIPRGWARWLRVVRALVLVPAMCIFSIWVVFVSDPFW